MRSACTVWCLLCSAWLVASGQSGRVLGRYVPQLWGADQGFASGRISAVAQTPDGYLWIGTDKNLLRFDGFSFQPILTTDGRAVLSVTDLTVDHLGTLWVHTEDAHLLRVEGERVAAVLSQRQGDRNVIAVAAAEPSGLVVSDIAEGVLHIDDQHRQKLGLRPPHLAISLVQTGDGTIWLGTRGGGLYRSRGNTLSAIPTVGANAKINCLLPAGGNRLWLGTDQGLYILNMKSGSVEKRVQAYGSVQVLAMVQDHEGQLWVGTSEGLLRLSGDNAQWVLHADRSVTALLADREGNIWFGDGQTLERLRDTPVMTYNIPPAIARGGIGAIATDKHGRLWFAPLQGGLYWMVGGLIHKVSTAGIDHDVVYSIDCHEDDIWLGRKRGGLTQLHAQGDRFVEHTWTTKDGLPQNSIFAVRALANGDVWAAGLTSGVGRLVNGHFTTYDARQLDSGPVTAIEPTTDGSVWFATPNGLVSLRSELWQRFAAAVTLPTQEILSLCADGQNGLFVGTASGLAYVDRNGHVQLSAALPKDPVLGIALDGHGAVWISTTSQVFSLFDGTSKSLSSMSTPPRDYTAADGLINSAGVRRARSMVADTTGQVYFTTEAGVSVAHMAPSYASVPAFARIESVLADGLPLQLMGLAHVPSGTRRISFNFAGLDLRAPEQVQLRYRLDDFDQNWSEPTQTRQATYTNLQPGSYRFRLLARNSQGEWAQQESVLPVVVEPLLQQRWSFRIAILAVLLLSAIWIYRARMKFVRVQMSVLADERHAERTRIARELHDTLLQGFISVMLRLHVITEEVTEPARARNALDHILNVMERVIEDARLTVQGLRNAESQVPDLEEFFRDAEADVRRDSTAMYHVEIRGPKRDVRPIICQEASRIGLEAIQNAIRHSKARLITVYLHYTKSSLNLQISDDGVGMEAGLTSKGKAGHWGMVGMRERANNMGGRLDIVSSIGGGSTVSLVVPAKVAYRNDRRTDLLS